MSKMSLSILRESTNHHDKYVVAPANKVSKSNNVLFLLFVLSSAISGFCNR